MDPTMNETGHVVPTSIGSEVSTLIGSRWKAKGYADIAAKNPMSEIVKQLQSTLTHSRETAMLSGYVALIKANRELAVLLERTCFGRQITTSEKDEQWFQLSSEETFYMHHALQSLVVVNHNGIPLSSSDLWNHLKTFKATFPELYISYAHLRGKNWVVRAGTQYGADFVAYRHHPSLVHSDYAVIILQEGDDNMRQNERLRSWPDVHCSIRVCGSVAKTLLVLFVNKNGSDATLHSCFEQFSVHERVITRWVAEQCREEHCLEHD
ncbi:putative tRNA-splicing endonuclease subunit Sen2 [Platanthera guangdongensis]|uniref:tRNA-intron lyase n=1 Tax=Platanthera guangdongensis TaxID=2320717 RepID=A0ABR2MB95_9ASPA